MPQPPRTLGQMVNTRPVRRNMTPQEWAALQAQGSQGMQPQVAPLSLADLVMEAGGSFLDEADVSKYLLPAALLGMVRYKRGPKTLPVKESEWLRMRRENSGLGQIAEIDARKFQDLFEAQRGESLPWHPQRPARLRDLTSFDDYPKVFVDPFGKVDVMDGRHRIAEAARRGMRIPVAMSAETRLPAELLDSGLSPAARETAEKYHRAPVSDPLRERDTVFHATNPLYVESILQTGKLKPGNIHVDPGVSVSRVPRVASKASRAVSFVLDRAKMPRSRPYAEPGYGKTHGDDDVMSPHFEFEDRTYDQAIPLNAAREIWLDRQAMDAYQSVNDATRLRLGIEEPQSLTDMVRQLSEQYNIPLREFESGRQMHSGRVRPKQK